MAADVHSTQGNTIRQTLAAVRADLAAQRERVGVLLSAVEQGQALGSGSLGSEGPSPVLEALQARVQALGVRERGVERQQQRDRDDGLAL